MSNVFDRIYRIVSRIPKGYVTTYGQVACLAGNPRGARVVGFRVARQPRPRKNTLPQGGEPFRGR